MTSIVAAFLDLFADAILPFLAGVLIGAVLEVFLPKSWSERWLTSDRSSLLIATFAGALLPGCAMSTVPVARSLRARGVPLGTVAAFLLIAPLISPHTIALTAALVGGGFAVARVLLPVAFTLAFGALANALTSTGPAPSPTAAASTQTPSCGCGGDSGECCDSAASPHGNSAWRRLVRQVRANLRALAPLFLGSLALVAVLTMFVQPVDVARHGNGPLAYLAALLAGIPLYVCDGGEVPLTRSLLTLGLGAGPAFTFMLASVGTCIPTITMAVAIIGRKLTIAYVTGILGLALLSGLAVAAVPALHPGLGTQVAPSARP